MIHCVIMVDSANFKFLVYISIMKLIITIFTQISPKSNPLLHPPHPPLKGGQGG